jgi:hypothetical protein
MHSSSSSSVILNEVSVVADIGAWVVRLVGKKSLAQAVNVRYVDAMYFDPAVAAVRAVTRGRG